MTGESAPASVVARAALAGDLEGMVAAACDAVRGDDGDAAASAARLVGAHLVRRPDDLADARRRLDKAVRQSSLSKAKRSRRAAKVYQALVDGFTYPPVVVVGDYDEERVEQHMRETRARDEARRRLDAEARQEAAGATIDADGYVDVAAFLAGGYTPPEPSVGGVLPDLSRMLYAGKVHTIVGESGIGKTFAALAMIVDELRHDGRVVLVDADFNGLDALHRLASMARGYGVDPATLADPSRFRLAMVADAAAYLAVLADVADWSPSLVVLDSEAQIVPMFGGDSNSADDYARVNREAFAPFAAAGAAVLTIDHVAKTARDSGYASGTGAKRAVRDGVIYTAKSVEPFRPDEGGALALEVSKDRFGGALRVMPGGGVVFRLDSRGDAWTWDFYPIRPDEARDGDDLAALVALDPAPTSRRDVMDRLGWGTNRAGKVLAAYRARIASQPTTLPLHPTSDTTANPQGD